MMEDAQSSSWADLQPELLGLVLNRLPSLDDRVRLRAACRPWRSNARLQPLPPPLPWLSLLDGTFLTIPDGKIIRMPVPDGACCCGSIDNWLFFMQSDGGCSLVNPFTEASLGLPKLATAWRRDLFNASSEYHPCFYKLAVPSPLDLDSSLDSLVAVLISDDGNSGTTVCICQPPIATDLYTGRHRGPFHQLFDIAFFDGKLHGVDFGCKLLTFEISYDPDDKPKISSVECIINSRERSSLPPPLSNKKGYTLRGYLVECCGRLLMVQRLIEGSGLRPGGRDSFEHHRTAGFVVFEADLSTKPGRWIRINKLGGQALFVGKHCSKSFPAGECTGIQEDCIYFMCDYALPECAANPFRDSGVCNMRNGMIMPLLSDSAATPMYRAGQWRPTWIFPADSM
ncbi:hypothetical protein ACP70R_042288 [Stipagrostis hirtigluma subsp. patula]